MNKMSITQINQKINSLPEDMLKELDEYIDFFKYKYSQKELKVNLTEQQLQLIEKGRNDLIQGKVLSHSEAKEKIKNHVKNKQF